MPADTYIQARCPNPACGREFRVESESLGKSVTCAVCGQRFIPSAPSPEVASRPPRPPAPLAQAHAVCDPKSMPAVAIVTPVAPSQDVNRGQHPGEPTINIAPSKPRLWFGLLLVISAFLAPSFPGFTLTVGVVLAVLISLYLTDDRTGPMRRGVGHFLRVSTDRPTWRTVKLTTFSLVAVALMGFAAAGYIAQRPSAERAAKKAAEEGARAQPQIAADQRPAVDEAARVQLQVAADQRLAADEAARVQAQVEADARLAAARARAQVDANARVTRLVDRAKASLTAANVARARQDIDEALKLSAAQNRDVALALQGAIKNSDDPAWALDVLVRLSDAELAAFKAYGAPPASLDLGYPVLTRKAVANARASTDAALAKRAEIRKREQEAAEAARQEAEAAKQKAEAAKQKAAAEAEERRRVEKAEAAAEAKERIKAAEARAAAEAEAARKAREELIEKQFSGWDGSHRGLTEYIKKSMNDPDSYQHDETTYIDKGDHLIVYTKFRGKNAFGGVVRNSAVAKVDLQGNILEVVFQGP